MKLKVSLPTTTRTFNHEQLLRGSVPYGTPGLAIAVTRLLSLKVPYFSFYFFIALTFLSIVFPFNLLFAQDTSVQVAPEMQLRSANYSNNQLVWRVDEILLNNKKIQRQVRRAKAIRTRSKFKSAKKLTKSLRNRNEKLHELLQDAPEGVSDIISYLSLSSRLRKDLSKLAPKLVALLETPVSEIEGQIERSVVEWDEEHSNRPSLVYSLVSSAEQRYQLHFANNLSFTNNQLPSSGRVMIRGAVRIMANSGDANLIVTGSIEPKPSTALPAGNTPMLGTRSIAVILLNFQDNPLQFATKETIRSKFFDSNGLTVNQFYKENSNSQFSFSGDVFDWITVPYNSNGSCYSSPWEQFANSQLQTQGVQLENYQHIVYIWPSRNASGSVRTTCQFSGRANVGTTYQGWVDINQQVSSDGTANIDNLGWVSSHELGHNLGLLHASSRDCRPYSIASSAYCNNGEYSDNTDTMGSGWFQFNAPHRYALGWLTNDNIQDVSTSGTYTLAPLAGASSGIKVLRIQKPDTNETYYLSYRQFFGAFDSSLNSNNINRTFIHLTSANPSANTFTHSYVLYGNPINNSTVYDFNNYGLRDGQYFEDPQNFSVKQLGHTDSSVTLLVQFGPLECIRNQPKIEFPQNFIGYFFFNAGAAKSYNFRLLNTDTFACPPSTITVSSSLPMGWAQTPNNFSFEMSPNHALEIPFTINVPANASVGSYNITEVLSSSSGISSSPATTVVSVVSNDVTPPSPPSQFVAVANQNSVTLSWSPASDNVGITNYIIQRNGMNYGNGAGSNASFTISPSQTSFIDTTVVPGKGYLYYLNARDSVSNYSTTNSVGVAIPTSTSDPLTPSVLLSFPTNNSLVSGTVNLIPIVSDNIGVSSVEFKLDTFTSLATLTSPPFIYSWNSRVVDNNSHSLTAIARDAVGNIAQSQIFVGLANDRYDLYNPTVNFVSPATGVISGAAYPIQVTASDNMDVPSVKLLIDQVEVQTLNTPPYTFSLNTIAFSNGLHTLYATATDSVGRTTTATKQVYITGSIVTPIATSTRTPILTATATRTATSAPTLPMASTNTATPIVTQIPSSPTNTPTRTPTLTPLQSTATPSRTATPSATSTLDPSQVGQCAFNWSSISANSSPNSSVHAVINWDPDGAGPQPAKLIVGGSFTSVGGVAANYIASWDGTQWQPLGTGMNHEVRSLSIYNGELIAGGSFTMAGGVSVNYIARWNGSSWQPLGLGVSTSIERMTVYNNELIVGGYFGYANGSSTLVNALARWNGVTWQSVGGGVGGQMPYVFGLIVYNGELIVAGSFTTAGGIAANRIARWNGSSWQAMGGSTSDTVVDLIVYNNELIAAGAFSTLGGSAANRIARWSGSSWQQLGSGIIGNGVYALGIFNNELIAAGDFTSAGGISSNSAARWNGTTWQSIGAGTTKYIYSLSVFNNELIAGGDFDTTHGAVGNWILRSGSSCGTPIATPTNIATPTVTKTATPTSMPTAVVTLPPPTITPTRTATQTSTPQQPTVTATATRTATPTGSAFLLNITSPHENDVVHGTVTITADASDPSGISQVRFFRGYNWPLGATTTPPYSAQWDTLIYDDNVSYLLVVEACNNAIPSTCIMKTVNVTVNNSGAAIPTFTPTRTASPTATKTSTPTATPISTATTIPPTITPTKTPTPQQSVTSTATPTRTATPALTATRTPTFSPTISGSDVIPPSVSFIAPANGATPILDFIIKVAASDNVGVAYVDIYANGIWLAHDSSAPFEVKWSDVLPNVTGTYTLRARAFDAAGNFRDSELIQVTILPDTTAPDLTITYPVDGTVVSGSVKIKATVTDQDSGINQVRFFRGNSPLGSFGFDPDNQYEVDWNTLTSENGTYKLYVDACDNAQPEHICTLKSVNVTVNNF